MTEASANGASRSASRPPAPSPELAPGAAAAPLGERAADSLPDQEADRAGARGAEPRAQILAGASPRTVLARISSGDPLGIRGIVAARLRARWLVLDAEPVFVRALARIAAGAPHWRGRPPLAAWLDHEVDRAIDHVQAECARPSPRWPSASQPGETLARPLGLDGPTARALLAAFNERTREEREAFQRLVLAAEPLDRVAGEAGVSASEIGRRARRALDALLAVGSREPAHSAAPSGARVSISNRGGPRSEPRSAPSTHSTFGEAPRT